MQNTPGKNFILCSMIFFFGWLLSVPLYGPVFMAAAPSEGVPPQSLVTVFILFHTVSLLTGGILFRETGSWHALMTFSLRAVLLVQFLLLVLPPGAWIPGMAVLGVASALYILGWGIIYSLGAREHPAVSIMASVILGANLILLASTVLSPYVPPAGLLILSAVPLVAAGILLQSISKDKQAVLVKPHVRIPVPRGILILLPLLALALYLNGGLMYRVMLPALSVSSRFGTYYPFLIYMVVLGVLSRLKGTVRKAVLVYLGVCLLGLAFIVFALTHHFTSGYLLTIGLMEASFALLDLFLWSTLGLLSMIYGSPVLLYGLALSANTMGILLGDRIGAALLMIGETRYLLTALVSAASLLLAFIVIPLLVEILEEKKNLVKPSEMEDRGSTDILLPYRLPGQTLTEREKEVLRLTLLGMTNRDMASELYISEHTVKTHLKSICGKFGVTRKKELLLLAARKDISISGSADSD